MYGERGQDFDLEFDADIQAIPIFMEKVLSDAVARNGSRIKLERDSKGFTITVEVNGEFLPSAEPPDWSWDRCVSRLKALARMVDYGSNISTEGAFQIDSKATSGVTFHLTSNPNPHKDRELIVEIVRE